MWKLCLRLMLIGIICVCALPDNASVASKLVRKREASQRYCGRKLVDILKFLCRSKYHGMEYDRKRRSADYYSGENPFKELGMKYEDHDDEFLNQLEALDEFPELHYPFRSRSEANTLMNRLFRRRQKRNDGGIVDECCIYKGCTVNELTDYCSAR